MVKYIKPTTDFERKFSQISSKDELDEVYAENIKYYRQKLEVLADFYEVGLPFTLELPEKLIKISNELSNLGTAYINRLNAIEDK